MMSMWTGHSGSGAKRLVDEVAERLREKIYAGEFHPGDRLRQEQLAADLRVSRTPLREALRVLERDGLVKVTSSRGVEVVPQAQIDLVSAYEVREVIDGLAAALTARRCQSDLEMQLRRQIEFQHEALAPWNPRLWIRLNLAFHSLILEQAGNPYLDPYLVLIRLTAQIFFPQQLLDPVHAASALQEHEQICAAICAHDPARAEAMAREHMHRTVLAIRPATPPVANLA